MNSRVIRNERAKRDIAEHIVYLGERNPPAAVRLKNALDEAFKLLAENPEIGPLVTDMPRLLHVRLRKWPVRQFPSIVIFYREIPSGVRIVRVLHSSLDYHRILGSEN